MQIEHIDTSNLIDSLNFDKPGIQIFGEKILSIKYKMV